jgi:hypothetical protein
MKAILCFVTMICLISVGASATSREEINLQGQLTYSNGDPIDSTVAITFDIYNVPSSGTSMWSETHSSVTVTDGVFDVVLGSSNSLPDTLFANNDSLYVQSTVGSTIISPRIRLASVPWAFDAETLDGLDGSGYALDPHDHLGERWICTVEDTVLNIVGCDHGIFVSVDSIAFFGTGSTDSIPAVIGRNTTLGVLGYLAGRDRGGLTRPGVQVGVEGFLTSQARRGALGTEREGVFGYDAVNETEGALACAAEPQLTPILGQLPAGAYGYAHISPGTGGTFYNDAGPSAPGNGDDWALIIGQGHLAAAGMNPGMGPTVPPIGMGPASVASMWFGAPTPWIMGSPTGAGVSSIFVPDATVTPTSLIWVFPTMAIYPGSFPGGPPIGTWWIDMILPGQGFHVASTANEVNLPDFVYWLVN